VRLVKSFGLARIEARVRDLTTELIERASAAGVAVRTPRDWSERAGIVSFRLPGAAEDMVGRLAAAGVIANAKDGYVRASLHAYNSSEDIDRLLKCVLNHG
jgi:selenocysteine lyase/cysteine desulfurase